MLTEHPPNKNYHSEIVKHMEEIKKIPIDWLEKMETILDSIEKTTNEYEEQVYRAQEFFTSMYDVPITPDRMRDGSRKKLPRAGYTPENANQLVVLISRTLVYRKNFVELATNFLKLNTENVYTLQNCYKTQFASLGNH